MSNLRCGYVKNANTGEQCGGELILCTRGHNHDVYKCTKKGCERTNRISHEPSAVA